MLFLPFAKIVVLSLALISKQINPLFHIFFSSPLSSYALLPLALLATKQPRKHFSEDFCAPIPEGIREGISIADAYGRITYVSKQMADILGYTVDEVIGRSIYDFVDPSTRPQIKQRWERRRRGIGERKEIQFCRKDGSHLWAVSASNPLFAEDGKFKGLLSIITEINESRKDEEFHRIAEEMFSPAFKASPDATAITRLLDGKLIQCNKAFTQEFGYSFDEVIGHTTVELGIWPEGAREEFVKVLAEKGELVSKEINMRRRDGGIVTMLLSSWRYTILDETVLLTVTRDITLRKRAEDALRESEEKLRLVVSNVPLVLFNINRAGIFTLSEGLGLKPLGVEPGQVVGKSVYDVYRDVPEIIRVVDLTFAGEPQHHEVNIFGAWYEAWYNPVKTQGEVTGLIGVAADITDEKRAQEERRQFYRKTIEAATEGKLIITDRRTTLEMAGPPIAQQQIVKGDDLAKVRRMIADVAQSEGISESKTFDLVFGAGEATANVIKHAGIGEVSVHSVTNGLLIIVSDHGPGIPALSLPEVALKRGYTTAISLGMGYKAMISIADHVYLATGPTGTTVAIEMLLKQEHKTSLLDSLPDTWA